MISADCLDLILLQGTLGTHLEVDHSLSTLLKGWTFHAIDTIGHSGGVTIGFNPKSIKILNI